MAPSFGGPLKGGLMKSGQGLAHGLGAKLTPLRFNYSRIFIFITNLPFCMLRVFLCCLYLSFAMITYSVRVYEVAGLKTPLKDKESLIRVVEGLKEL